MRTYTETKNKKSFNWHGALSVDPRYITWLVLHTMEHKASNWVTCACGSQCEIIPRASDGSPLDPTLRNLGVEFTEAICKIIQHVSKSEWKGANENRLKATDILKEIEERSAAIITRITEPF